MLVFRGLVFGVLGILAVVCVCSCTPRQFGATSGGFYGTGPSGFAVAVSPPLELAGAGSRGTPVPSDVTVRPRGSFMYSVFTEPGAFTGSKEITKHAHIVFSELPRYVWVWEMETWAKKESFSYEKDKTGGKYWTMQVFPLAAAGDWFSELYKANGHIVPDFWLAKRWSSTTNDTMRLVAEYREPAPACMRSQLETGVDERGNLSILTRSVMADCQGEITAFSQRADRAINPGGLAETAAAGSADRLGVLPSGAPAMDKLVGRAQHVDREGSNYRD